MTQPTSAVVDFEGVYRAHVRYVWRVLLRLGVRRADLEDVCQEVFTVVHRKLPEFEGRSALRTWVHSIAYRAASEYRRRPWVRREESATERFEEPDPELPIEALELRERRRILEQILEQLDDDRRAVFVLYELEGLPMNEVVTIVDCPLQTGYSRLRSARELVKLAVARRQRKELSA